MRYVISIIVGFIVAGCLFLIMRSFISGNHSAPQTVRETQLVNFVSAPRHEEVQTKQRQAPQKPKEQKPPPQAPKVQVSSQQKVQAPHLNINVPNLGVPTPGAGGSGPYLGSGFSVSNLSGNGEAIPIVPIAPNYPTQALLNGVEGYVTVAFTIQPDGSATDPEVVKAEPRRIFNSAAIQAVLRSKFKPKVVDGKAMKSRAQYTYRFSLGKDNG